MNLAITKMLIPTNRYYLKSGYTMKPQGAVLHNTYSYATALQEASYMSGNNKYSSMHAYCDEARAVQTLPLNRSAWHATDGSNGYANRNLFGVEVCRSRSDLATFLKAEDNACEFIALGFLDLELEPSLQTIRYHEEFVATACPHRTKEQGDRARIVRKVKEKMDALRGTATPPTTPSKVVAVGNIVTIQSGAVYGGLTTARGKAIPASQLTPKRHTVAAIGSNKGVKEARLKEIASWVAVDRLNIV